MEFASKCSKNSWNATVLNPVGILYTYKLLDSVSKFAYTSLLFNLLAIGAENDGV